MDAIEQLVKDHVDAKNAMDVIAQSWGDKKLELFKALKKDLEIHNGLEEDLFFPAVRQKPSASALGAQDQQAHAAVEQALDRLSQLMIDDPDWIPTFNAMREQLLKHVGDEESVYFQKVREALTSEELHGLGRRMAAERDRLMSAAKGA
jgi:iron-sulfur cluster repair protein YtfE (RIC family)